MRHFSRETVIEGKSITVTTEEVGTAMKKLTADKTAGSGNIPAEFAKEHPSEALQNDSSTIHNMHK